MDVLSNRTRHLSCETPSQRWEVTGHHAGHEVVDKCCTRDEFQEEYFTSTSALCQKSKFSRP